MTVREAPIRVALPCTGLGRQRRGFEAFTRELFTALRETSDLELRVFGGGGALHDPETAVWNLSRDSRAARWASLLSGYGPYFIEQMTFFAGFLPTLVGWQPHVVYFGDLNLGNACWHWRRWSGQRFRLLYYNGGPTTRPYTRCDLVQQMTPAHHAAALIRGERPERMVTLPHGFTLPPVAARRDDHRVQATRAALGVRDGRRMLLSVGMLSATHKRMDILVDAVASLGESRPHLVMLGQETGETAQLRDQAHTRLGEGVWLGAWPRERMKDAYEAADAFALLSLDEGFGLAYVEALAAGLPCAVHANANTAYILGDLAYRGDVSTAASAADVIDGALREETTDALRECRLAWVRDRFGWDALAPRYVELLRTCAAGRRPDWGDG